MQIVNTAAASGTGLTAGLFGQQNQAAGGIFGLMMALFGQSGQQAGMLPGAVPATATPGQNVPSTLQGMTGTLPKLPIGTLIELADAAQLNATNSTANGADLLNWLQSLSANAGISPELKSLLAGDQIDLATFQQRLGNLSEEQREAVLGEIAGLLQPVIPVMVPVAVAKGGESHVIDAAAGKPATPAPTLPAAPEAAAPIANAPEQKAAAPIQPAATAEAAAEAPEAATTSLQAAAAPTQAPVADRPAPRREGKIRLEMPTAPIKANAETAAIDATNMAKLQAAADAQLGTQTANKAHTTAKHEDAANAAGAVASAQPIQQGQPQQTNTNNKSANTETSIKPVAAAGAEGKGNESGLPEFKTDTQANNAAPLPQQDKTNAPSFADHLQHVKLNRTGAHMPVAEQISVQMGKAVAEGTGRFTVKLTPVELGRIEIKIDMSADGRVTASFQVDQPATLDLLQRDQRGLERVLSDAGLKTDGTSLNFNLRGDGNGHQQQGQQAQNDNRGNGNGNGFNLDGDMADEIASAGTMEVSWYVGPDRVDVRI